MSVVTKRFVATLKVMKQERMINSFRQLALAVDYLPQSLSEIINGRRDVPLEVLRKTIALYNINANFLFTGDGPRFLSNTKVEDSSIQTIVLDHSNQEKIMLVTQHEQADYAMELDHANLLSRLDFIQLPELLNQKNRYRAFEVSGDAMEPILYEGDRVISSWIEPNLWSKIIRDHYVYVVVTHDNIYINRIKNQLASDGLIILCSDNIYYGNITVPLADIREIWFIRIKVSPFLASPKNVKLALHDELDTIQTMIKEQTQTIRILNESLQSDSEIDDEQGDEQENS